MGVVRGGEIGRTWVTPWISGWVQKIGRSESREVGAAIGRWARWLARVWNNIPYPGYGIALAYIYIYIYLHSRRETTTARQRDVVDRPVITDGRQSAGENWKVRDYGSKCRRVHGKKTRLVYAIDRGHSFSTPWEPTTLSFPWQFGIDESATRPHACKCEPAFLRRPSPAGPALPPPVNLARRK
jgi:hypothetical protein